MSYLVTTTNITTTGTNLVYKEITISSKDRVSSSNSSTDFTITFPQPVSFTNLYVKSAFIPQTFYTIPIGITTGSPLTTFIFTMEIGGNFAQINIPYGSYTNTTLAAAIQSALNAIVDPYFSDFTVAINNLTSIITITNPDAPFIINITSSLQFQIMQMLGLAPRYLDPNDVVFPYYLNSETATTPYTLIGTATVNLQYYINLYIKSTAIANAINPYGLFSSGAAVDGDNPLNPVNTTIATIPTNSAFTYVLWNNQSSLRFNLDPTYIFYQMDFQLSGDYGFIVDLNGQDWTMVLAGYG